MGGGSIHGEEKDMNRIMDELYEMGAKAILASAIHAIRL